MNGIAILAAVYALYVPTTAETWKGNPKVLPLRPLAGNFISEKEEDAALEVELAYAAGIDGFVVKGAVPKGLSAAAAKKGFKLLTARPDDAVEVNVGGEHVFTRRLQMAKETGRDILLDSWNVIPHGDCLLPDFRNLNLNLMEVWKVFGRSKQNVPCVAMRQFWRHDAPNGKFFTVPTPDFLNVKYGSHIRQGLDIWLPKKTVKPAKGYPVVVIIHGGGWDSGDRHSVLGVGDGHTVNESGMLVRALKTGVAVVTVSYRMLQDATDNGIYPPVRWPLEDAVAAIQFLRENVARFSLDVDRMMVTGGSAGAFSTEYAALYHDGELGIKVIYLQSPQTTIDPKESKEWIPNQTYGGHAFGVCDFNKFLAEREKHLQWIRKISPAGLFRTCTPSKMPAILYDGPKLPPPGKLPPDPVHAAMFCLKLQEICDSRGISCRRGDLSDALKALLK